MMILSRTLALVAPILFAAACTAPVKQEASVKPVDSLFREYYTFKKRINPIEATKAGYDAYNDQVANYISTPYQEDLRVNYQNFLNELDRYDSTQVTPAQWMSLEVMRWDCQIKLQGLKNPLVTIASPMYDMPNFELMPLLQIQSLHLYFSQLAGGQSLQPFRNVNDYDAWIRRVDAFLPFLDTAVVKMKQGMSRGLVLPRILIERMIPQLDGFAKAPVADHLFYKPIALMPQTFQPPIENGSHGCMPTWSPTRSLPDTRCSRISLSGNTCRPVVRAPVSTCCPVALKHSSISSSTSRPPT